MPHWTTRLCAWPLLLASASAMADSRIRDIDYADDSVVRLEGCFGFQTMVEFARSEHIENVGLGDAAQWLVVPNKRANLLFVKPAYRVSHSNMTVSTDRRRYSFELVAKASEACKRGAVVYHLRFRYPDEPPPAPPVATPPAPTAEEAGEPEQRNTTYTFAGARENVPLRVFDNGRSTFFRWAEGAATPAVYAVGLDKSESLVGFASRGDYLVVDQVAPAFVLRRGDAVATLYNDGYRMPQWDEASPQPRAESELQEKPRRSWFFRRKRGTSDGH